MNHATQIHMARVLLEQARHSRRHPAWHATLLQWAAMRRRRAAGEALLGNQPHEQGELFEGGSDAEKLQKSRPGETLSRRGPGRHRRNPKDGGKKGGEGNRRKSHQKTAAARQTEKG